MGRRYIVAAMHEAVIAELSHISALRMIPRTSVARYRNTEKSVPIAGELQADALVEGSVFKTETGYASSCSSSRRRE